MKNYRRMISANIRYSPPFLRPGSVAVEHLSGVSRINNQSQPKRLSNCGRFFLVPFKILKKRRFHKVFAEYEIVHNLRTTLNLPKIVDIIYLDVNRSF